MNIVKLQNDLKDLSDQQLLSTMQSGASPQYLVLAEMQRRKKMREEAATPNEPQAQGTVADEIMGGIAAIPMGSMDMASGGLVSFAEGGRGKDKDKEEDRDWRYYKPNAGLFGKTDTPLMMLNPQYWSNMLQDMQGVPREEWRGQGAPGVLAYAKGGPTGLQKGEMEACWTNPETGEKMCPPAKPTVEYPKTGQRKSMAGGGIVALQAGGTPSEARAMLAQRGVDTTGMSDEEVMGIAATYAGVMAPNVDVAEPSPTGFAPVSPDMSVAPPPMTPPEPAPKAEPSFMDKLTGGITNLLGIGDAVAAETPPVENPVVPIEVMKDPEQARNWLGENAPAWYDPSKRSDEQVLEDIKSYQPGGAQYEARQRGQGAKPPVQTGEEPTDTVVAEDLPKVSPEGVGVYAQSAARATDPAEKSRLMETDAAYQRAVPVPGHEGWRYDGETGMYFNPEGRLESGPVGGFTGTTRNRFEKREDAKGAEARQQKVDAAQAAVNQYINNQNVEPTKASDALMDLYNEIMAERKGGKDAKDRSTNEALMRAGFAMMSSKNPDFFGALGEGGIEGLKAYTESQKTETARRKDLTGEAVDLLAARERSVSGAVTAAVSQAESIRKRIDDIIEKYGPQSAAPKAEQEAAAKAIEALEKQYNALLGMQGMVTGGYGLSPGATRAMQGISGVTGTR